MLELGAPLALLSRRSSVIWAVIACLFHWGVFFVMGITFRYQLCGIAFAAFFVPSAMEGKLISRTSTENCLLIGERCPS